MGTSEESTVTVFWRPGCGFCTRLLTHLERTGIPVRKINIWEDPEAAAAVRGVAGGNETVPTVVVAGIPMVNPSGEEVVAAVRANAPGLLADE